MAMDLERLVNADSGLVSRRIFIEPEIYERELQRIFARCWLFLCHDSMIPNPGDFLSTYMGEDSILVTRDNDGKVHALLNVLSPQGKPGVPCGYGQCIQLYVYLSWVDLQKRWEADRCTELPKKRTTGS